MTRQQVFRKLTFSLALPGLLFFTGCSGCKGKQESDTSQRTLQSPTNAPAISDATNALVTNAAPTLDDKTASPVGISGKIILKGTPPPERNIAMDPTCGALHQGPIKSRLYVVGNDGALGDVFVYIKKGLEGKTFPAPEQPVLLDQVGCEYTPYVLGLQTGQKLLVRNSDPLMHNVHPIPKVPGNKESNKAQMPKSADMQFVFDNPEIFLTFKCDIHPWMYTYVGVVDHPFFAVSGKDGKFHLKNVPDGKYVVEAVHRKAGRQTKEITVVNGQSAPVEFTFEAAGQ